jgi:hypothetical protein
MANLPPKVIIEILIKEIGIYEVERLVKEHKMKMDL